MDSQRYCISRALRSPQVWIIGSMLGVIVLATAASSSNLSHYSHHDRSFNRKSMVGLEVSQTKNDFGLMIESTLNKMASGNCNFYFICNCNCKCHYGAREHDRVLPEGSSAILMQLEETMSNESSLSENDKVQNKQLVPAFDEQKIEYYIKKFDCNLTSLLWQVKDLKLLVGNQNKKITVLQRDLYMKEDEVQKLRHELMMKDREAELALKKRLLDDATELIRRQEEKLEELQAELGEKAHLEGKIKNIEDNLEKQTVECLSAQEELKALAKKVIFTEKNVAELHKQNLQVISYLNNSKESDVRKLIIQLREVHRNGAKWEQRNQLMAWLLEELRKEKLASYDACYLPELIDSEQVLKNAGIAEVQNALADVHKYIAKLKRLMTKKRWEIIEAITWLKEAENHILSMQQELHDVKVKFHAAMSSVEKIAQWANGFVVSMKNDRDTARMEIELQMMIESLR